ncbi:MAG: tyrosine-type recombinase/integrase [Clostridiales bacterium]|nr:tyrosine-type recombinase/integrase [Clostridiales bacterium]
MPITNQDLHALTTILVDKVRSYGILEVSIGQYKTVCSHNCSFATTRNVNSYSPELMDEYLAHLEIKIQEGTVSFGYGRFQKRVIHMLGSLAETGEVDFTAAHQTIRKYPVPEDVSSLIDAILAENRIPGTVRTDLLAPMRHLFWYAGQQGYEWSTLDDKVVMKYLITEVSVSNSGSTGRALRCVKYITEYMKANKIGHLLHDYTKLKLKNAHVRIIPAFSEEEISDISSAIDTATPLGMRDYAIILLAYGTGLRGVDIVGLKLSDVDWRGQKAKVFQFKTHSPLIVELNGEILNSLADYVLAARPECEAPEVFITTKAPYRKLSSGFAGMIDKYCEKAHVEKIPLRAFHSLRRAFETVLVSNGVPIETASRMMGHKTVTEDKPYITYDKEHTSFIAMGFADVPIRHGIYAGAGMQHQTDGGGEVL